MKLILIIPQFNSHLFKLKDNRNRRGLETNTLDFKTADDGVNQLQKCSCFYKI